MKASKPRTEERRQGGWEGAVTWEPLLDSAAAHSSIQWDMAKVRVIWHKLLQGIVNTRTVGVGPTKTGSCCSTAQTNGNWNTQVQSCCFWALSKKRKFCVSKANLPNSKILSENVLEKNWAQTRTELQTGGGAECIGRVLTSVTLSGLALVTSLPLPKCA